MSVNYEKAEKEFQAVLALTQTFPPNDLRTAETLTKLASLYIWREIKFAEAETRQKQPASFLPSRGDSLPVWGTLEACVASKELWH
jgi:hypothetical protein